MICYKRTHSFCGFFFYRKTKRKILKSRSSSHINNIEIVLKKNDVRISMKNIKKKKSLLLTFFNKTEIGQDIKYSSFIILSLIGFVIIPELLGFLVVQLTSLKNTFSNFCDKEEYFYKCWALGLLIGIFLFGIGLLFYYSYKFFLDITRNINLAKIEQLLPITKEEWEITDIKTKEDIFDALKNIFTENKRSDLYEHISWYIFPDFIDSIASGYEVLWENAKESFISKDIHNQEKLNEIKTIYITFRILASEDLPCYLKTECANYMKGDATYLKYDDYIKSDAESVNSCPNYSKILPRLRSDEQLAEKFDKFMEKVEEEFEEFLNNCTK